jgi:hypothetical protein
MKTMLLKGVAIACIATLILCGCNKESGAASSAMPRNNVNAVTVTAQEVDAELDRRINYFASVFGSTEKVEEYYGKPIAQLKKDFRGDVEKQLIADKMKKLNPASK